MKNKTNSEIVIKMNHIDNANRLYKFLRDALSVADMGGDLILTYDGAEKESKTIGHDVRALEVIHNISEEK